MSKSVIGRKRAVEGRTHLFSGVLWAVLTAIALMGSGCVENSTDPSSGLACGSDEAWVMTKSDARNLLGAMTFAQIEAQYGPLLNDVNAVGIVLKPDNNVVVIIELKWSDALVGGLAQMMAGEDATNAMINQAKASIYFVFGVQKDDRGWYGITAKDFEATGESNLKWKQNGNSLIITDPYGEDSEPIPFTISGNSLTVTEEGAPPITLTKKTGINVRLLDDRLQMIMDMAGDGDDGDDDPGTGGGNCPSTQPGCPGYVDPGTSSSGLVLGNNQAWTFTDEDGDTGGFIFKANGDLVIVSLEDGDWVGATMGTWSVSGSNVTFNLAALTGVPPMTGPYSISGNYLTITIDGESETYTKTSNVNYTDLGGLYKSPTGRKEYPLLSKLISK